LLKSSYLDISLLKLKYRLRNAAFKRVACRCKIDHEVDFYVLFCNHLRLTKCVMWCISYVNSFVCRVFTHKILSRNCHLVCINSGGARPGPAGAPRRTKWIKINWVNWEIKRQATLYITVQTHVITVSMWWHVLSTVSHYDCGEVSEY